MVIPTLCTLTYIHTHAHSVESFAYFASLIEMRGSRRVISCCLRDYKGKITVITIILPFVMNDRAEDEKFFLELNVFFNRSNIIYIWEIDELFMHATLFMVC